MIFIIYHHGAVLGRSSRYWSKKARLIAQNAMHSFEIAFESAPSGDISVNADEACAAIGSANVFFGE
ncbi:MAG: hypothetical protein WAK31_15235 [Chthoniobacterales bacterium]